jgi:hypothetical protein
MIKNLLAVSAIALGLGLAAVPLASADCGKEKCAEKCACDSKCDCSKDKCDCAEGSCKDGTCDHGKKKKK